MAVVEHNEMVPKWIWHMRWIAPIFMGLVSVLFIVGGMGNRQLARVNEWPETRGTIMSIELRTDNDPEGPDTLRPIIRYTFKVDGKDYEGRRFDYSVNGESILPSDKDSILKTFAQGTEVTVFYDPDNPEDSVLHRYDSSDADRTVIVGIVSLLCTVGVMIMFARAKRPAFLE